MERQLLRDLTEGCAPPEKAARLGRVAILEEMGFFGDKTNYALAVGPHPGSFTAAIRKRFSGLYGDVAGCHPADIEIAAVMLGVDEDVYDLRLGGGNGTPA